MASPEAGPSLESLDWPAATQRLTVRPATADDPEATWRYRRLDSVNHWITAAPSTVDAYRQRFEDAASLAKTLVIELDGEVIGDLMVAVEDAWAQTEVADEAEGTQAELGWALHPDREGHGYATETVAELLRICFVDLGLRRVTAQCFADNVSSRRLMERVGMRPESHLVRDSLHRSGIWMDTSGYALLEDEWRAARPL